MNHPSATGLHLRRVLHIPMTSGTCVKARHPVPDDPIVIRRIYDITATCGRQNKDSDDPPVTLHFRGEQSTPLLRCLAVGAAVIGIAAAAAVVCRVRQHWQIRRQYARRYADRLKELRRLRHMNRPHSSVQKHVS